MTKSAVRLIALTLAILLASLLIVRVEGAAVIGIDLGTEWIKVGLRKSGAPIDVVLNEQSKRKTAFMIGFRDDERYFGEAARALSTRFPDTMFKYLNLLLGKTFDEDAKAIKERFDQLHIPIRLVKNEKRGTINVQVDDKTQYTTDELFAMIFKYIKHLTADNAKGAIPECIITIPPFYTIQEKQAILDAAAIADLRVLTLMQESTAIALQYGLTKLKFLKEQTDPYNVVFYDMGAHTVKVSIATYINQTEKGSLGYFTMGESDWDSALGGVDFDIRLAEHFASAFHKKHGIDVTKYPRAITRLIESAKRTKEVLSANTETVAMVESLQDDKDFMLPITRKEFEEMCSNLLQRVTLPLERLLKKSGLSKNQIHSIELIGGGSRVPAIQALLKKFIGKELSYSLNSDEAIALGSAFHATYLSPAFSVKSFLFNDIDTPAKQAPTNETETATTEQKQAEKKESEQPVSKIPAITEEEKSSAKSKLAALDQRDKLKKDISAARNSLEAALYEFRYQLLDEEKYKPFYTSKESADLIAKIEATDAWLSDYDDNRIVVEVEKIYIDKLSKLKQITQPILDRFSQVGLRKKSISKCRDILSKAKSFETTFKTIFKHITEEEWAELGKLVNETETWVNSTIAKQEKTALSQAPIALASEYEDKCVPVTYKVATIRQKPIPKPKVEKKPDNQTATAETKPENQTEPAQGTETEQPATETESETQQGEENGEKVKKDEL